MQVRNGIGQQVCCFDGKVWITQEGDARDIFLHAGECFVLNRSGLAIISPLGATELQLSDTRETRPAGRRPAGFTKYADS